MDDCGVELVSVSKTFGSDAPAVQDLTLRVTRGSFVSLLGPSGCGKTTTLRMIAGLEVPDAGAIRILDRPVFSAGTGIDVPPAQRKVGFVFQSYALWPHMSVFENLAYPLRRAGLKQQAIADKVDATLRLLKAAQLARRYPGELSGGQQQRIALGRAIINADNRVILFDEPLSNLDAKLREELRLEIRALQEELRFTAIYVTHDQAEAMSMSDHVVIMNAGRIEREGDPASVFHDPQTRYVAEFFGAHNILQASVISATDGALVLDTALGTVRGVSHAQMQPQPGGAIAVALAADCIELGPERHPEHSFAATVEAVAYYGNHSDVRISVAGCLLRCRVGDGRRYRRGQKVSGRATAAAVHLER